MRGVATCKEFKVELSTKTFPALRRGAGTLSALVLPMMLAACVDVNSPLLVRLAPQTPQSAPQDAAADPGIAAASTGAGLSAWRSSPHCRMMKFPTPLDVDTAYARVMRTFNFQTEQEVQNIEKSYTMTRRDPIYKHTANRGSFYRMEQLVKIQNQGSGQRRLHLAMTLAKEGKGTSVDAGYCTDPENADGTLPPYHDHVQKTIRAVFK